MCKTATVSLNKQKTTLASLATDQRFYILGATEQLSISVETGYDYRSICEVQDALFKLVSFLGQDHKLKTLDVHIEVQMKAGEWDGFELCTSNWMERYVSEKIAREFKKIKPGEISRAHVVAFLSDPLRTIRVHGGEGAGSGFELRFDGCEEKLYDGSEEYVNPWHDIVKQTAECVSGTTGLRDFNVFGPYFGLLGQLTQLLETGFEPKKLSVMKQLLEMMAATRIRRNVLSFHSLHDRLVKALEDITQRPTASENTHSKNPASDGATQQYDGLRVSPQKLIDALPAKELDTSHLGYSQADAKLADWRKHREEAGLVQDEEEEYDSDLDEEFFRHGRINVDLNCLTR